MNFKEAAKAYAEGKVFVAFDLETTGLDPSRDRIVEIGAVKFDRTGLIARFSTLVNPGIPMPAEAGRVNGITDNMLAGKPSLEKVFPDFLLFIRGAALAAHNAPFDTGFVNAKLSEGWKAAGGRETDLLLPLDEGGVWAPPFPTLPNPIADTLAFSRERFPAQNSHSLQNLAAGLDIDARDAHRAEDDARLCMEIFVRCIRDVAFGGHCC